MKYIIEIKPEYEDSFKGLMILGAKDSNLFVDTLAVENLEELNSDYIKWKNEDGCTGCKYEGKTGEHLPCDYCMNNFKNQWTAKDDEIKVGDVVRLCRHKVPYIVTSCDGVDDTYILMSVNGGFLKAEKCNVSKTGRHFDIDKILEEMRHD